MTHQPDKEPQQVRNELTFKLLGHTKRDDGLIGRYQLEVTDTSSERTVTISAEPKHLASARCMKTLLLDRCMFYRATRKEHDEMVLAMFNPQPDHTET